jgi:hypothetical protein
MASLLSAFDWLGTPLPWIEFCNYALLLSQPYAFLASAAFFKDG